MIINLNNECLFKADEITDIRRWKSDKWKDRKEPYQLKIDFNFRGKEYIQEWQYSHEGKRNDDWSKLIELIYDPRNNQTNP